MKKICAGFIFIASLLIFNSCQKEVNNTAPNVSTDSIAAITFNSAVCYVTVKTDGGEAVTARGVCKSFSPNPTIESIITSEGTGVGAFSSILTGLEPNKNYYVRAYAINGVGIAYGNELTFNTATAAPEFSSMNIDSVSATEALISGNINNSKEISYSECGICWDITREPKVSVTNKFILNIGPFSASMTDLKANTLYYLRHYAIYSEDTMYSGIDSLTTIPVLSTTKITSVAAIYAIGGGTINNQSNGDANIKARGVCLATTPNPTIKNRKTTNGKGKGIFYSGITALQSNTTYYLRSYATNDGGTAYGDEISFTTLETKKLTFTLTMVANPTSEQANAYKLITAAMDTAVLYYDLYTTWTKTLYVSYNPGVPTAQASNSGYIDFGSNTTYMKKHTAMHEISHTLGVGQNASWWTLRVNNIWQGANANAALQAISGNPADSIHGDNAHFWPHGLNYESEGTSPTDLKNHCLIMEGFKKDGL